MMAIAQGVPALLQLGTGVGQFITGRKQLKELERPKYEIPLGYQAALGQAQSLASSQEMAGMSQAEMRMNQALALGVQQAQQTAGSSSEALGAITNMFANRMAQQTGLAGQAAQDYARRQAELTQQNLMMGQQQEKQQQYNVLQPYEEAAAAASAMGGAGMQNIMGGIQGAGGAIAGAYAQKGQFDMMEKMFGGGQKKLVDDGIDAIDYGSRLSGSDLAGSLKSGVEAAPGLMPRSETDLSLERLMQQNTQRLLAQQPADRALNYSKVGVGASDSVPEPMPIDYGNRLSGSDLGSSIQSSTILGQSGINVGGLSNYRSMFDEVNKLLGLTPAQLSAIASASQR